jgi:D-3-phosphoglycerate dehydrogenase
MAGPFRIVATDAIHPDAVALLAPLGGVALPDDDGEAALRAAVADADALIVRRRLPDDLFDAAPRLKFVVRHGVGLDYIPVDAATAAGIVVANQPDANTNAVVEHVVGVLLTIARRFGWLNARLLAGEWDARNRAGTFELRGRTLGIVGLGRIGGGVAAAAHSGLGMAVLAHDPTVAQKPDHVTDTPLDALLAKADFVTFHVPLTDTTHRMIDAALLARMAKHAWLINAARGELVDDAALVTALRERRIAGAALDVYAPEPLAADSPYRGLDNVLLTPHSAALTEEAVRRMGMGSAEDVVRVLGGGRPRSFVNPQVWERRRR